MKINRFLLLLGAGFLASCGEVSSAASSSVEPEYYNPIDSSIVEEFEKETLSEQEYGVLCAKLGEAPHDFDFDLTYGKCGSIQESVNIKGRYVGEVFVEGDRSRSYSILDSSAGKAEYYEAMVTDSAASQSSLGNFSQITCLKYDGELECGALLIHNEEEIVRYGDPNKPAIYPAASDPAFAEMKTPLNDYLALSFFPRIANIPITNLYGPDFSERTFSYEGKEYSDTAAHSHDVSSTHIVIRESCKGIMIPNYWKTEQLSSYWAALTEGNYSVQKVFHYNLKTSRMDKATFSINTIDTVFNVNGELSLDMTFNFRYEDENAIAKMHNEKIEAFKAIEGVTALQ